MSVEETTAVKAIPRHRLPDIRRKNRLGVCFMVSALPVFGLSAFVIVKAERISVMAGFFLLVLFGQNRMSR